MSGGVGDGVRVGTGPEVGGVVQSGHSGHSASDPAGSPGHAGHVEPLEVGNIEVEVVINTEVPAVRPKPTTSLLRSELAPQLSTASR